MTKTEIEERFETVWKLYPDHTGKKEAKKHYLASVKSEADVQRCLKALRNYQRSERVCNGYVQNGSTWFNNWEDWEDPTPSMMGKVLSTVQKPAKTVAPLVLMTECEACHTPHRSTDVCPNCFPVCKDCGQRHLRTETCEDWQKRTDSLKSLFQGTARIEKPVSVGSLLK